MYLGALMTGYPIILFKFEENLGMFQFSLVSSWIDLLFWQNSELLMDFVFCVLLALYHSDKHMFLYILVMIFFEIVCRLCKNF